MLIQKIEVVMSKLAAPLTESEEAAGWTEESKNAIFKSLLNLLAELKSGQEIPYVGLVRGHDAWGVERGGLLYEEVMEITRELNSRF